MPAFDPDGNVRTPAVSDVIRRVRSGSSAAVRAGKRPLKLVLSPTDRRRYQRACDVEGVPPHFLTPEFGDIPIEKSPWDPWPSSVIVDMGSSEAPVRRAL